MALAGPTAVWVASGHREARPLIVCKHILGHLEEHGILTDLQHGFRTGRSCETQLITTFQDIASAYNKKGSQIPITKNTTGIRGIYITITSTTMVFANEKTRFTTITSTTITFTITNFTANIFLNYYKYFKIIS